MMRTENEGGANNQAPPQFYASARLMAMPWCWNRGKLRNFHAVGKPKNEGTVVKNEGAIEHNEGTAESDNDN